MDPQRPTAQAIAIIANRIAAVGTAEEIGALRGPRTRVIEAGGGTVLPGFNEGHMHLFLGAAALPISSFAASKASATYNARSRISTAPIPGTASSSANPPTTPSCQRPSHSAAITSTASCPTAR